MFRFHCSHILVKRQSYKNLLTPQNLKCHADFIFASDIPVSDYLSNFARNLRLMTRYAEIILPLPLNATFTYVVPESMAQSVDIGYRVIVPFGNKKYYTGIVVAFTAAPPANFETKEISLVLDNKPVIRHPQVKLWQWISEYYLCPIGDVYRAAIPAGLKIESETFIEQNPDYELDESNGMSAEEAIVLSQLEHNGAMRVSEIEKATRLPHVSRLITTMLDRGSVIISEKLVERYKPRHESFVRLAFDATAGLKDAFAAVKGASRQEMMLTTLLMLTKNSADVTVASLLERSGCSRAILTALRDKGLVTIERREVNRFMLADTPSEKLPVLTDAQSEALRGIYNVWDEKPVALLHGVTSSGKTEIYATLIAEVLRQGRQALYLVPEIALTTQLTHRLQDIFGDRIIIYHSKFSDNERVDIWRKLLDSSAPCVVLGARSAVFLPFSHLGLVIVDEEHDPSYKQQEPSPRYNGRDVAIVLAAMHGAKTLLGSATPLVETYYKAETGKFGLVTLTQRYSDLPLPPVEVVDMIKSRKQGDVRGSFAGRTAAAIRDTVAAGRQAIVFHNRRGFAPMARCGACGHIPKCECCDVSLTYHKRLNRLVCHYCGATYPLPSLCPNCHEPKIDIIGYGTERVEDEVKQLFPDARIARMDLDTTRNKSSYADIIDDFSAHKNDILVGTQMVSKGLDFGGVDTVAALNADSIINFPDFRASERAFNMLEQVAGRAGRHTKDNNRASVIVQTSQPDNQVIVNLVNHDYMSHYRGELQDRRKFNYPPFTRIIYLYIRHKDSRILDKLAADFAAQLRTRLGNRVFGPEEPPVGRVQLYYIRKIMLKIEVEASVSAVKRALNDVFVAMAESSRDLRAARIHYDVDPM